MYALAFSPRALANNASLKTPGHLPPKAVGQSREAVETILLRIRLKIRGESCGTIADGLLKEISEGLRGVPEKTRQKLSARLPKIFCNFPCIGRGANRGELFANNPILLLECL